MASFDCPEPVGHWWGDIQGGGHMGVGGGSSNVILTPQKFKTDEWCWVALCTPPTASLCTMLRNDIRNSKQYWCQWVTGSPEEATWEWMILNFKAGCTPWYLGPWIRFRSAVTRKDPITIRKCEGRTSPRTREDGVRSLASGEGRPERKGRLENGFWFTYPKFGSETLGVWRISELGVTDMVWFKGPTNESGCSQFWSWMGCFCVSCGTETSLCEVFGVTQTEYNLLLPLNGCPERKCPRRKTEEHPRADSTMARGSCLFSELQRVFSRLRAHTHPPGAGMELLNTMWFHEASGSGGGNLRCMKASPLAARWAFGSAKEAYGLKDHIVKQLFSRDLEHKEERSKEHLRQASLYNEVKNTAFGRLAQKKNDRGGHLNVLLSHKAGRKLKHTNYEERSGSPNLGFYDEEMRQEPIYCGVYHSAYPVNFESRPKNVPVAQDSTRDLSITSTIFPKLPAQNSYERFPYGEVVVTNQSKKKGPPFWRHHEVTYKGRNLQERRSSKNIHEDDDGRNSPMVVEAELGGHLVHRMCVDEGSASEWGISWPLGQISLLVSLGDTEHSTSAWRNFMVVRSPSPYNDIIGRPRIRNIQAVPSTAHGMLKILVWEGVVTFHSSRIYYQKNAEL
ncbi:hypothetical protein Tco_0865571 [Tanacetum coccineum]